jgi:exportin-2 (importin alpha re-exporter)
MALDLQTVAQLLQATLDHRQHKQGIIQRLFSRWVFVHADIYTAEIALKQEETKPNFSLLLLQIVSTEDLPLNTRLAGALCFKNFIKFNWVVSFAMTAFLARVSKL